MTLTSGLTNKRVLVTAASRGIGYGAAKSFLEEGCRVVVNSSNADRLKEAVKNLGHAGRVFGVAGDLSDKNEIDNLVSETVRLLGGIDTLVYVTGSPKPGPFMEQGYEDWESAARLLTVSPAYLARKTGEAMMNAGVSGKMVFCASYVIKEPSPNLALSNVCRIAIAGLVRTLARELAPKKIRVNGILPGYIRTGRVDQVVSDNARRQGISKEQALSDIEKQIPLGYVASTEELARSIVFLGSDLSSYVTGALLPVDGGILRSVF
ncbi:MAG: SDR family oxidoreductase [Nitrososphaerota archaeon]|nr:SDR family oxidoreductase [Nitrososphaerota archaeon]